MIWTEHTLLAGSLLDLGSGTNADETVVRLELLQGLGGVVDESEAGALTTTVLRAETEDGDLVLVGLVQVGQLLAELVLGDVGAVGVEDVPKFAKTCQIGVFDGGWLGSCVCCILRWRSCFSCWVVVRFEGCALSKYFHHTQIQRGEKSGGSYTTICLRASRGLRMNLRVRRVTGVSAILVCALDGGSVDGVTEDVELSIFCGQGLG